MAEPKVLDFDRARADRRKTVLRAWERDIPVPSSPPLNFVMLTDGLRREHGPDHEPTFEEMAELVEAMLGEGTFEWIMSHAPEQDDLEWIMEAVMEGWEDDDEGEAPAPTPGAGSSTSESTGDSSRPTSPESTEKTSQLPSETPGIRSESLPSA